MMISTILLDQKLSFLLGFVISFTAVFLFEYAAHVFKCPVLYEDTSETFQILVKNLSKLSSNYETWRDNQNIQDSRINLDAFIYGAQSNSDSGISKKMLEADWLKQKTSITCVVLVENVTMSVAIKNTWGKHCNHLQFFSGNTSDRYVPVINLSIKYSDSWQLLCGVMNYVWSQKDKLQLQWLIFVKDNTFVIPENLRFLLAPLNFQDPYYLGHGDMLWGLPYNVAKAGYVLSYGALDKLINIFNTSKKCASDANYKNNGDYYLAKQLASLKIYPSDTRDYEGKKTFHKFSTRVFWENPKTDNSYSQAISLQGPECCSKRSVTFNVENSHKMLTLNYLLYGLFIFHKGAFGNVPAPTQIPESEVWKIALFREFNLTIIDEISSDELYQIWLSKFPIKTDEPDFNAQLTVIIVIIMVLICLIVKKRRSELRVLRVWYSRYKTNYFLVFS